MAGAARITAGYDERPLDFVFPPAAPRAAPAFDARALVEPLANAIGRVCGAAAQVTLATTPGDARGLDWQAGDGLTVALDGGDRLASALLGRRCGGGFVAEACAPTPSVARVRGEILALVRDALAASLGATIGAWASTGKVADAPVWRFTVAVADVADNFDIALVAPPVAPVSGDWPARLAACLAALTIPVRVVLHDGGIAVRAARRLGVGDVLPLATAHEVGVRAGPLLIARGRIAGTGDGQPRIEIVARGRPA